MKRSIILLAFTTLLASCSGDEKKDDSKTEQAVIKAPKIALDEKKDDSKTEQTVTKAPKIAFDEKLDLSKYDLPVVISVPKGTVVDNQLYGTYVNNGPDFDFQVSMDFYQTVNERKTEFADIDFKKRGSFVLETANGFIAENIFMGKAEYHAFYLLQGDGFTIALENQKGRLFSQEEAELMFAAFETAKPLKYVKTSSY